MDQNPLIDSFTSWELDFKCNGNKATLVDKASGCSYYCINSLHSYITLEEAGELRMRVLCFTLHIIIHNFASFKSRSGKNIFPI